MKMKNIWIYAVFLALIFSCNSDFSNTEMQLVTDRETYGINDTFEITVIISPKNGEKEISFFEDFNNLDIYFSLKEDEFAFSQPLKKHFVEGPIKTNRYIISKSNPFIKTFHGTITEMSDEISFEIPELISIYTVEKSVLLENSTVTLNIKCYNVGSQVPVEEFFISKDISVLIE